MTKFYPNENMIIAGDEWHKLRLRNIGGSEIAGLFDVQQDYQLSRFALHQVKSGKVKDTFAGNERTLWGNRLEDAIAHGIAEENGWSIRKGGYFSDPYTSGMGSTLDYIITDNPLYDGPGVLEIKNVDGIVYNDKWVDDEPPLHILLQLQHQIACSGFKWGIIGALIGGNTSRIFYYDARPAIISQIRQRVSSFWIDVENDHVPPVDGSSNTSAIIKAMHSPVQKTEHTSDDPELVDLCKEFNLARQQKKDKEAAYNLAKNRIAEKVGSIQKTHVAEFTISQVITKPTEPRVALPGEIISGRAESRRYDVKLRKSKR